MSAARRYRVQIQEWMVWKTYIDAANLEDAKEKAEALWTAEGPDAFKLMDNGTDDIEAEDIGPAEGEDGEAAL